MNDSTDAALRRDVQRLAAAVQMLADAVMMLAGSQEPGLRDLAQDAYELARQAATPER